MWEYKGDGEFIPGVPARDMTDKEMDQHPEAKKSDLYKHVRSRGRDAGDETDA